jgi:hypothetical protein
LLRPTPWLLAEAAGAIWSERSLLEAQSKSGTQVRFAQAFCAAQSVSGAPRRSAVQRMRRHALSGVPQIVRAGELWGHVQLHRAVCAGLQAKGQQSISPAV